MTAYAALRAVVLENPHARLVQIVPALQDMVIELIACGLFEGSPQRPEYTVAGRVAHALTCEINWRRRFMRTTERLVEHVLEKHRRTLGVPTIRNAEKEVLAALEKLRVAGIAEIDHSRGTGQAWRLIVE